jgi:hypothetical protein
MKRFVPLLLLLLTPVLTACPPPSYVTLFNNTGMPLGVETAGDHATVAPNRFTRLENFWWASAVFRVSSGGCEYLYDVSSAEADYPTDPYTRRGIQIQVEQDLSVNLLPSSYAGEAPLSSEMVLRGNGFPLKPVSRKCPKSDL